MKWYTDIRTYQVDHIQHILYVPEPVGLADYQLDLVVSSLDPGVAQPELYGVQYVLLMSLDLLVKIMKHGDPAVARPSEPVV